MFKCLALPFSPNLYMCGCENFCIYGMIQCTCNHMASVLAANPSKKRKKQQKRKGRPVSPEPQIVTAVAEAPSSVGSFLPPLPSLSSLPARLNRVKDVQPDEDGFYNFTVSTVSAQSRLVAGWLCFASIVSLAATFCVLSQQNIATL